MVTEIQIPDTLKIGGFTYTIETGKGINRELTARNAYADSNDMLRLIRLTTDVSEEQTFNDFIHELLHQIDSVYNGHKLDEPCVTLLANGFHQVLDQLGIRFVREKELDKHSK